MHPACIDIDLHREIGVLLRRRRGSWGSAIMVLCRAMIEAICSTLDRKNDISPERAMAHA
jgi:hypothetical protein